MSSTSALRLLSSGLKPSSTIPRSRWLTRRLHQRRPLVYPVELGLGKFMPPQALQVAVEWQNGLLERLNEEVKGTSEENATVVQTVINTSIQKERTLAFNYASLALNHGYALDQMKPVSEKGTHEHEISHDLMHAIESHHGSLRQLKSSVSAAALGMFTNGWIWFVTDSKGVTGILPTFGPSTLLVRSRTYVAADKGLTFGDSYIAKTDLPLTSVTPPSSPTPTPQLPGTASSPVSGTTFSNAPPTPDVHGPRFMSTERFKYQHRKPTIHDTTTSTNQNVADILNVGESIFPLFCIPVYEHAWMSAGYGVWGKEEWLKEFWSVVDWAKVSNAYKIATVGKNDHV